MNGPFLNTHIYRYPSWVMAATSADKIENVLKHVELGSDHYALFLGNSWGPWKTHIDEDQAKPQESVQNLTPQITHTFSHRSLLQWGIQKLEKFHRFNDKLEYTCMCIRFNDKLEYTEARKIPRFPNARSSEPVPRDSVLGGGNSDLGYRVPDLRPETTTGRHNGGRHTRSWGAMAEPWGVTTGRHNGRKTTGKWFKMRNVTFIILILFKK